MVSFIDKKHLMVLESEPARRLNHFATAFFGYYLQGRADDFEYFSQGFVSHFDDLAWGMYEGN
jgi:hypothetical protein